MKTALDNRTDNPYRVCYACHKRYVSYADKYLLLCPVCWDKREAQALIVGVARWQKR